VLVTNLRDFLLVGQDAESNQVKPEAYRLAANEAEFWQAAAHPRRLAAIVLLEPALNANYQSVKASPYAWPGRQT
jgi:hypothetical protein